jgi:hypothetical protein
MRQSFARAGFLVAAILLALAGVMTMSGTAAAEKQPNTLELATATRPCASPCGVQDAVVIPANTDIHTYCAHNGYNVAYTGSSTGRGGFFFRLRLEFPELQQQSCAEAGAFASVTTSSTVRSCSGACVNFGQASAGNTTGVFCQLGSSPNRWFLVYVDQIQRAGFLPQSALNPLPNVPSCNQGI